MSLVARELRVRLGKAEVLHGVDLTIGSGESVAIVGPNGSGKSTLVRTLAGLLRPAGGRATLDGAAVRAMNPRRRAARLGLLAQAAEAPGLTTVAEYVGLGRHAARSFLSRWTGEDRNAVRDALATCEVTHRRERRMEQLSGGERQRVRLATLLAQSPEHLLLDEPLTGLDIEHQLGLLDLLRELNADRGRTVVCVLHDLDLAMRYFDRIVVMHAGVVAADGAPLDVLTPGLLAEVFGVDGRIEHAGGEPVLRCRARSPSQIASAPGPAPMPEPAPEIVVRVGPGPSRAEPGTGAVLGR